MSATLELTRKLVARPSVTPDDAGCQVLLGERLQAIGFTVEPMRFGKVSNLWARRGTAAPLLVFAGHTDVVPSGPEDAWTTPPFTPLSASASRNMPGHVSWTRGKDLRSLIQKRSIICRA